MLDEIINELGAYYSEEDKAILSSIVDEVSTNALSLSNQLSTDNLETEIKQCVKVIYLRRGTEHNKSLNANGESSTYIDPYQELRDNIVKNGKRRLY